MVNKLSIVIMAHPKRKDLIPYLKEKLGDVSVVWDEKNDLWDTCRRAWLAQDFKCKYAVVIQDDALITSDFRKKAEKIIKGDQIYSFYLSRLIGNRVRLAIQKGSHSILSEMIFNEVAICMPTKYIKEMVKFCDDHQATNDQFINKWARQKGKQICYPIPSLTSHRDELESIYRANNNLVQPDRERKAIEFYE